MPDIINAGDTTQGSAQQGGSRPLRVGDKVTIGGRRILIIRINPAGTNPPAVGEDPIGNEVNVSAGDISGTGYTLPGSSDALGTPPPAAGIDVSPRFEAGTPAPPSASITGISPGTPGPGVDLGFTPGPFPGQDGGLTPNQLAGQIDITPEERFGRGIGEPAALQNFISQRFPTVAGPYRRFLDSQQDELLNRFFVDAALGRTNAEFFSQYLPQMQGGLTTRGIDRSMLNSLAQFIAMQPDAFSGVQESSLESLRQDPSRQLQILTEALAPRAGSRFRAPMENLLQRQFLELMGSPIAQEEGFQFLPHVASRDFRLGNY